MMAYGTNEYFARIVALGFTIFVTFMSDRLLRNIIMRRNQKWVPALAGMMAVWFVIMWVASSSYSGSIFNPFTGEAQARYVKIDGVIKKFPKGMNYDPDTNRPLQDFDTATADEYKKQQEGPAKPAKPISKKEQGFFESLFSSTPVARPVVLTDSWSSGGLDVQIDKMIVGSQNTILVLSAHGGKNISDLYPSAVAYLTDQNGVVYNLIQSSVEFMTFKGFWGNYEARQVLAGEVYHYRMVFPPLGSDAVKIKFHIQQYGINNTLEEVELDALFVNAERVASLPSPPPLVTEAPKPAPPPVETPQPVGLVAETKSEPAPQTPVRVGSGISPPRRTKYVKPEYPRFAVLARVQGKVVIEATIDVNGRVIEAKIVKSVVSYLDEASLVAIRQWEFIPTMKDGVYVPVIMTVTVDFTLE